MLTNLEIRNFKRFKHVEIELGDPVVFIGPNNSGKTSAMQALMLWSIGLKHWIARRRGQSVPEKRPGVTVNRRDLVAIPVPHATLLWHDLRTRNTYRRRGQQRTENIRIEITVRGLSVNGEWECGLEFDYANPESIYCRPLRDSECNLQRMSVPSEADSVNVALLPPMSGLVASETRLDQGAVDVRVGEGRTAEVLRNLCHVIDTQYPERWQQLTEQMNRHFGVELERPQYIQGRGEIQMQYRERGVSLDLSSSGRGLQQTLLILSYMHANPGAVLLLDEPDAHLEILRQRQNYEMITQAAEESGSQVIAASHSEVLLNEAAGKHTVIAFVGKPHRVNRGSQVLKALNEIGFEQYVQAEQTGWVLYLEGSTDLAILQAFAERLDHADARAVLSSPFVHYVGNHLARAEFHFYGLREALPKLVGIAVLDDFKGDAGSAGLKCMKWRRREIENYLCTPRTLEAYAAATVREVGGKSEFDPDLGGMFSDAESERRVELMRDSIKEVEHAMTTLRRTSPWDPLTKTSDDFLTPLFEGFFERLDWPNLMRKTYFHKLVRHMPKEEIDHEIVEKLDAIVSVAQKAKPAEPME